MIQPVSPRYRGSLRVFTYSMAEQSRQTTYLVALAALIKVIPRAAYAHELPTVSQLITCGQTTQCRDPFCQHIAQLMPLLLRGLSLPDPTLRAGVINTLFSAAQVDLEAGSKTSKEGSVVSEHAVSLTKAMLQNSAVASMPDMVRLPHF